jgi:tetratricopeptide (TPR) repeat protein
MESARALVAEVAPSPIKALVLSELSRYHMLGGRHDEAVVVGREALAMAEELGLDVICAHALNNIGAARAAFGDRGGFADLERSIEIATAANSPELMRGYTNLAAMYGQWGDNDRSTEAQDEGLRLGERFGPTDMLHWLDISRRLFRPYTYGQWDEAAAYADELIAGERHYIQRSAYGIRSVVRLSRGDVAGGVQDAMECLHRAREQKDPQALLPALACAAFASMAAGKLADAERHVDEVVAFDPALYLGPTLFYLPWVLQALGRTDELADVLSRVPRPSPWLEAGKAIADGEFARAARFYAQPPAPAWEAYAHLRAAQVGDPEADLHRAIDVFREMNATAYLAEAEHLVKATA